MLVFRGCMFFFHLNMTIPWNNCNALRHVAMRQYRITCYFKRVARPQLQQLGRAKRG